MTKRNLQVAVEEVQDIIHNQIAIVMQIAVGEDAEMTCGEALDEGILQAAKHIVTVLDDLGF